MERVKFQVGFRDGKPDEQPFKKAHKPNAIVNGGLSSAQRNSKTLLSHVVEKTTDHELAQLYTARTPLGRGGCFVSFAYVADAFPVRRGDFLGRDAEDERREL
jgi:hypothetical protein